GAAAGDLRWRLAAYDEGGRCGSHPAVADGQYRIEGLEPGEYLIALELTEGRAQRRYNRFADVAADSDTRVDYDVTLGEASVAGHVITPFLGLDDYVFVAAFEPGTCPIGISQEFSELELIGLAAIQDSFDDGAFAFNYLPADTFDVVAVLIHFNEVVNLDVRCVTLKAGACVEVQLDLTK
ncbi:MAG TPA: hypothetical protein HPP77_04960, partial [Candidatus Hydrogenedentes bacterium]|nr:hypothetical protein [Candidatus Hydrogenedentota bacterium]